MKYSYYKSSKCVKKKKKTELGKISTPNYNVRKQRHKYDYFTTRSFYGYGRSEYGYFTTPRCYGYGSDDGEFSGHAGARAGERARLVHDG